MFARANRPRVDHDDAYRRSREDRLISESGSMHLAEAADALNMALLTLEGADEEGRVARRQRAGHVRRLLVEAVTALGRARVFVPGIRTYAVPVITSGATRTLDELRRQHQLATQLLWFNHEYLPRKPRVFPLSEEEEVQLARVFLDLDAHRRLDRFKAAAGAAALVGGSAAAAIFAGPAFVFGVGTLAAAYAITRGLRGRVVRDAIA